MVEELKEAVRCDKCKDLFPEDVMYPVRIIGPKKQINVFDTDSVYLCPDCRDGRIQAVAVIREKVKDASKSRLKI